MSGGSVGKLLQVASIAAAPFTGGASLAIQGAVAGAGALGTYLSGKQQAKEGAKAAAGAARAQRESALEASSRLQPYAEAGQSALPQLTSLVNDPNAQKSFIQDNPFFQSLADDAEKRLLANQASRGKIGSGGTAAELQNQLLTLGNSLVGEQVNRSQTLANTGQAAAGTQGGYITDAGNATAGGIVGAQNAKTDASNNSLNTLIQLEQLRKQGQKQTEQSKTPTGIIGL